MYRARGLTLVELMVSMTLGIVLLGGLVSIFVQNKTTYQMQSGLGALQESGRYAIARISRDIQQSGYGGCVSPDFSPHMIMLVAHPSSDDWLDDYLAGISVRTPTASTFGGVSLATGTNALEIVGPLDAAAGNVVGETAPGSPVIVTGDAAQFAAQEYAMLADCGGADVFLVTTRSTNSDGNAVLNHSTATVTRPDGSTTQNSQTNFSREFGSGSIVLQLARHIYFVADTGRNNNSNSTIRSLYLFDGTSTQELVEGIEDMQIQYGLDTDGDGSVDGFSDPAGVTDWTGVASVRISLLVNSIDSAGTVEANYLYVPSSSVAISPASGDYRLRQEFTRLVSVRNQTL